MNSRPFCLVLNIKKDVPASKPLQDWLMVIVSAHSVTITCVLLQQYVLAVNYQDEYSLHEEITDALGNDIKVCQVDSRSNLMLSLSPINAWFALFITCDSEVIMFSRSFCLFVCVRLCVFFVTLFVRTILVWKTGVRHTVFCRYASGDV